MTARAAHRTDLWGLALVAGALLPLGGCAEPEGDGLPSTLPRIENATFVKPTIIDGPLLPLLPGVVRVYFADTNEGPEVTVSSALAETREVTRVESRVVLERVFLDDRLVRTTRAFVAQDEDDAVWLMGEEIQEFVADEVPAGALTWEAGRDLAGVGVDAYPGWLMSADPQPGAVFHRAYHPDVVEDVIEVLARDVDVMLANGSTVSTLKTLASTRLDPDADAELYFAAGIGRVQASRVADEQRQELMARYRPGLISVPSFATVSFDASTTIDNEYFPLEVGVLRRSEGQTREGLEVLETEVLAETRMVAGIECLVVRHTVTRAGRLIEDTQHWYAQDDRGNVWHMGEAVDEYAYDAQGNMLEVTHEGSWEAGIDVAGTGVSAAPGHLMPAMVEVDRSYHQQWYEGVAEDLAYVVATGVRVDLPNGTVHGNCVQTLDWTALEPHALEYRFYAPGVGLVSTVPLGAPDEAVALVSG